MRLRTHLLRLSTAASLLLACSLLHAQDPDGRATPAQRAAAGIGGPVTPLPAASTLKPAEQKARIAAWRAEIRHQLFIPAHLPALEAHTWSTFSPPQVSSPTASPTRPQTACSSPPSSTVPTPDS